MTDAIYLIKKARFVFVCGNGGSAANAEHLTNDLLSRRIRAICLNSNVSVITMIANDYGYQYIFSKQLEILASSEDVLIVISCSGASPNIIEALKINMPSIKIFGGSGSPESMETEHLNIIHKLVESLGDKSL
jgi:D-sedoheptulose 7-phosphate isomerase